ncbi:Nitrogen regulatory protein P-II [Phycisphaerae bacterium RAS1]|nr:Nitrogen regulatory protein P-II [Phycisphaerae bacterium RAS1]
MKEIKAIIRPYRLDAVLDALHSHAELPGVTVSFVRGFGRTVGRTTTTSQTPIQYGTVEMAKVECVVNDDQVNAVVDIIQVAACTQSAGDGKIVVCNVTEVVKIRTGDRLRRIE